MAERAERAMERLYTTDNNGGSMEVPAGCLADLEAIGNVPLAELCERNPGLLVFPGDLSDSRDGIGGTPVFTIGGGRLATANVMGFVGRNATRLNIRSRFARDDASDYFLHYMLGRVFDANMLDFDQSAGGLGMIDYLDCLFPCCLRRAWAQGVYRAYVGRQCNDAGVKGRIDMARHLRTNMPFRGSVAYTMREYSADNSLMQLVRHTIEHLKAKPLARALLAADSQTRSIIDT